MTRTMTRTRAEHRARAAHEARRYPHDYLHTDRTYEQSQRDIGGSLFLGAVTLIALMALIVAGLLF